MASTSETYMSGFNTSESNPLFRQSQSMASMSPYNEKSDASSIPQLALPPARPMGSSPSSSESVTRSSDPNRLPPAPGYPYDYPSAGDENDAPILSGFPASNSAAQSYNQSQPMSQGYSASSHDDHRQRVPSSHSRGVSLVDTGPVPAAPHDPVRRVSRHQRRSSSRNQLVSPVTGSSNSSHLPPGAVSCSFGSMI